MPSFTSSYKRESLRTRVETVPLQPRITYADRIMLVGSCFTEHIGNRLTAMKFSTCVNPFGIVYNPLSIASQLNYLMDPAGFTRDGLVFHRDLWHSWQHHGKFSHPDAGRLLESITDLAVDASVFLDQAGLLVLTFGTADAYYLKEGDRLVSNCHQVPADRFYSRKPDPEELAEIWVPLIETLLKRNPDLRICLTISPVRYFKDGPTGNQVSKSILFLLVARLLEFFPNLYYFPSYEIFMDDLRDYRFYDTDMMHPGAAGLDYVWTRFTDACIDPAAYSLMEAVESAVRAANHRPGAHVTAAHRTFIGQQMDRIAVLRAANPFLDFTEEIDKLLGQAGSD